jgi:hypothetical protein
VQGLDGARPEGGEDMRRMEVITIVDSSDDEDDSDDDATASDAARGSTTRNARSVVINTRSSDETNNDDSSSSTSSSDDSIWKIKGLSITADKSSDAAKNIDDATFVGLFKGSCVITPTEAAFSSTQESQSRRYNPFKDDASSSSDSLVELGNATFDEDISSANTTPSHSSSHASLSSCRNAEEGHDCLVATTAVIQSFDEDSSSVSSEDSIWNKVGLRLPPSKFNNRNDGVATNLPVNLSRSKTNAPVSLTCRERRPCHDITNDDCVDTEHDTVTKQPHDITYYQQ